MATTRWEMLPMVVSENDSREDGTRPPDYIPVRLDPTSELARKLSERKNK